MINRDVSVVNELTCRYIDLINGVLGFASQNILPHLRVLVELISILKSLADIKMLKLRIILQLIRKV